jgi:SAM-dependent methyltransferase
LGLRTLASGGDRNQNDCPEVERRGRHEMNGKRLEPHEIERISTATLTYYEQRAEAFRAGTRDHDVSQNITALLRHIDGEPPLVILDFGCGPGRDLKTFAELGHTAIGLEGAAGFVAMARADTGCEVWQQDFHSLDLPGKHFDGIFANASLFHVPSQELPRVLRQLHGSLKPGGVLFSSNPHGQNEEGWNHGRYGAYLRSRGVASLHVGCGVPGARALLSTDRVTLWTTAVAGGCMAQAACSMLMRSGDTAA